MISISEAGWEFPFISSAAASVRSVERRKTIAVASAMLIILLVAFVPAFKKGASCMDEGMILVYPELLQQGKLPYRDFETFYGPANPALLAAVFSIAQANIFVERSVGLVYRLTILLAIFAIASRWGRVMAAGCVFLAGCLLVGTWLSAYAWLGAMACALWSLSSGARNDFGRACFLSGLLAGFALLFRVDVGPAVIVSALPLWWRRESAARQKFFLGGLLGICPLIFLAVFAGPRAVWENLFLFPVVYSSPGRHLPIFSVESCVRVVFFAHLIASAINFAAGALACRERVFVRQNRLLLAVALFGLGLTHQAAQRLDSLHVLFAAFLSIGILPISLLTLRRRPSRTAPRGSESALAVALVVVAMQIAVPELTLGVRASFADAFRKSRETFIEHDGRFFPFDERPTAVAVEQLLAKLIGLSTPGQRLFVGPADLRRTNYCDTYLYHLMPELTPATYFLEMNPFSANRPGSRLTNDIASADWLVLNRARDDWHEANRSMEFGPDAPNEVVRSAFDLRAEIGPFLLFQHKARIAGRAL